MKFVDAYLRSGVILVMKSGAMHRGVIESYDEQGEVASLVKVMTYGLGNLEFEPWRLFVSWLEVESVGLTHQ